MSPFVAGFAAGAAFGFAAAAWAALSAFRRMGLLRRRLDEQARR